MSVVAVKKFPGGFDISCDSIIVRNWASQSTGSNTKFSKLASINGMAIGGVGSAEELASMFIFAQNHSPISAEERHILEFLSEFSKWRQDRGLPANIENSYILGFHNKFDNRVFSIAQWFIDEILEYDAIGAGADFAMAALYLGNNTDSAVKTACKLSVYCELPVKTISVRGE